MSKSSKDYRDRAASELRRSRTETGSQKQESGARGASYKSMARNEEWLAGEPQRSNARDAKNLSPGQCRDQASRCRVLAQQAMAKPHQVMLNHIAETWDRIAEQIASPER